MGFNFKGRNGLELNEEVVNIKCPYERMMNEGLAHEYLHVPFLREGNKKGMGFIVCHKLLNEQ